MDATYDKLIALRNIREKFLQEVLQLLEGDISKDAVEVEIHIHNKEGNPERKMYDAAKDLGWASSFAGKTLWVSSKAHCGDVTIFSR